MRDVSVQERYIREYLEDYELNEDLMGQVLDLNTRYNKEVEKVIEFLQKNNFAYKGRIKAPVGEDNNNWVEKALK